MNFEEERLRMVELQIKGRGINNNRVLAAMRKVPRHLFVPREKQSSAYGDFPIPIGEGQTVSQPYMVAVMTEALDLSGHEKALEVGTGSGYQAAILAELAERVISIERIATLSDTAKKRLYELQYKNVNVYLGDGTLGWPSEAPFDAIIVTAGSPSTPSALLEQLSTGGRLVVPVGDKQSQMLNIYIKKSDGEFEITTTTACRFVDLIGEQGWKL